MILQTTLIREKQWGFSSGFVLLPSEAANLHPPGARRAAPRGRARAPRVAPAPTPLPSRQWCCPAGLLSCFATTAARRRAEGRAGPSQAKLSQAKPSQAKSSQVGPPAWVSGAGPPSSGSCCEGTSGVISSSLRAVRTRGAGIARACGAAPCLPRPLRDLQHPSDRAGV